MWYMRCGWELRGCSCAIYSPLKHTQLGASTHVRVRWSLVEASCAQSCPLIKGALQRQHLLCSVAAEAAPTIDGAYPFKAVRVMSHSKVTDIEEPSLRCLGPCVLLGPALELLYLPLGCGDDEWFGEHDDHMLFWTATDLENKLRDYQGYYNQLRCHSSRSGATPITSTDGIEVDLSSYRWKTHCRGLFQLPVAA